MYIMDIQRYNCIKYFFHRKGIHAKECHHHHKIYNVYSENKINIIQKWCLKDVLNEYFIITKHTDDNEESSFQAKSYFFFCVLCMLTGCVVVE